MRFPYIFSQYWPFFFSQLPPGKFDVSANSFLLIFLLKFALVTEELNFICMPTTFKFQPVALTPPQHWHLHESTQDSQSFKTYSSPSLRLSAFFILRDETHSASLSKSETWPLLFISQEMKSALPRLHSRPPVPLLGYSVLVVSTVHSCRSSGRDHLAGGPDPGAAEQVRSGMREQGGL